MAMASPVKLYHQEMHKNLGYFATWLPASIVELGDIGLLQDGRFRRVGSLREFGIALSEVREGTSEDMSYSDSAKRADGVVASAGVPKALGEGELSISFSRQGGFIFEAIGMRNIEIADRLAMADSILHVYEQGRWKPDWMVVEAMYRARSATIIVSEESASEVVLKAKAKVPDGVLPLADPSLGLTVSSSTGKVVHVLAGDDLCPLYSCVKVSDRWRPFGGPNVVPVRGDGSRDGLKALARPTIGDLLDS
jgi:hypothetical protein